MIPGYVLAINSVIWYVLFLYQVWRTFKAEKRGFIKGYLACQKDVKVLDKDK